MELKVACYCGQKYKFDVEPVDGRMPFTVNCPVCGVDGTPLANHLLTQQVTAPAPALTPAAAPAAAPAPLPPAPAPMAMPPIGSGLKINRPPPAAATPPPLAASSSAPPPLASSPRPIAPLRTAAVPKVQKEYSLGMGILGAFLGAFLGAGLVFGFFVLAGFRFPLSGTAIGVLAGFGAKWLAHGTDNTLGFFAGGFALIAIVGVFFLMYGGFFIFGIISIVICVGFAYRIASG